MNKKLEFNDFELYSFIKCVYYYVPTAKTRSLVEDIGMSDSNWLFNIKKEVVFNYLGWQSDDHPTHYNAHGFPEFESENKATMFLLTAILLHNETLNK